MNNFPNAKNLQKSLHHGKSQYCCPNISISKGCIGQEILKIISLEERNYLENSNECLDIYESMFSQLTTICCNILLPTHTQCNPNYTFRNLLYSEHISTEIPKSISKLASKMGRTKRQTKKILNEMELSIPVDFLIKVAEHFQIKELVFVIDVIDLLGK